MKDDAIVVATKAGGEGGWGSSLGETNAGENKGEDEEIGKKKTEGEFELTVIDGHKSLKAAGVKMG